MRHFRMVERHVEKYRQELFTSCDKCGEHIDRGHWTRNEIKIEATIGEVYPDGDFRDRIEADLCAECFTQIQVTLSAMGVKFREYKFEDRKDNEPVVIEP